MRKMQSFHCNNCGADYEAYCEEGTRAPCDTCKSQDVIKVITAPAIKVTGIGQYSSKMKV